MQTGGSGADTIQGKVAAKTVTNFKGQISIRNDRILHTSLSFK